MSEQTVHRDWPSGEEVEAAARGIHAQQEYSTRWDDDQAGAESRMGTPMRPLTEHGREFYRGLARAALVAVLSYKGEQGT